ncbi:MAG: hypothetical protein L3K17_09975, partial [Thermoplasmata archaeon]|nr:hypothetical protein [Thermoplasmata archaeon]
MPRAPVSSAARAESERIATVLAATWSTVNAATSGLHTERKWGSDWRVGTDLVVCVGAFAHHVGIEF